MHRTALTIAALFVLTVAPGRAQSSDRPDVVSDEGGVLIRQGLVLSGWDYFGRAWSVDPVEYALVRGSGIRPDEGVRMDSVRAWTRVVADSAGWMAHPDLRGGGYLFAEVASETDDVKD